MISKDSPIPLYDQLITTLVDQITTRMKPNEKMMSEREICNQYEVSRTTVRLALSELENMGYIYKRPGKGTYVSSLEFIKQNLADNYSFTDQMREAGKVPETRLLSFSVLHANPIVAEKMKISSKDEVYCIERLRLADGEPMMVEMSFIPVKSFPNLTETLLQSKPMYDIFKENYNNPVKVADEEFKASILSKKEADLLVQKEGMACLKLERVSYDKAQIVVEYTLSTARSDQFSYRIRHVK